MSQTGLVEVADDDASSTQQARRGSGSQTDRAGASNVDGAAWAYTGSHGTVVTSRQDVR